MRELKEKTKRVFPFLLNESARKILSPEKFEALKKLQEKMQKQHAEEKGMKAPTREEFQEVVARARESGRQAADKRYKELLSNQEEEYCLIIHNMTQYNLRSICEAAEEAALEVLKEALGVEGYVEGVTD